MSMQRRSRGLRECCRLLGYTPQAYYQHQSGSTERKLEEELFIGQVFVHRRLQPRLGARKLLIMMQPFMQAHNIFIGRDTFFDLLRINGLLIRRRRGNPRTTNSFHRFRTYPDLVKGLSITRVEQLWVSDITYICLRDEFAYLSLVTDVYSHKIVGYCLNKRLSMDGPLQALEMAIKGRTGSELLMHHSDRGSQYCSAGYIKMLNDHQINISMTQSGDPRDNAIAERVNGILKQELLEEDYACFEQANQSVAKAIHIYNGHRPHSSIDMLTPEQAHYKTGILQRRWRNYYRKGIKEAVMNTD